MFEEIPISVQRSFEFLCQKFMQGKKLLRMDVINRNRTIRAKTQLTQNQVILKIPYDYCIHDRTKEAEQSPLIKYYQWLKENSLKNKQKQQQLQQFISQLNQIDIGLYNLLYLLECKFINRTAITYEKKVHQHYISTLPQDYEYHPLNHANSIQPFHPQMHQQLSDMNKWFAKYTKTIQKLIMHRFKDTSFEQYLTSLKLYNLYEDYVNHFTESKIRWGLLVLKTRHFSGKRLVPLLDLFNHSHQENAEWNFVNEQSVFKLIAIRNIKEGEQIFVSYGDRTIQDLFLFFKWDYDASELSNKRQLIETIKKQKFVSQCKPYQREQFYAQLFNQCQLQKFRTRNCFYDIKQYTNKGNKLASSECLQNILDKEMNFLEWITANKVFILADLKSDK